VNASPTEYDLLIIGGGINGAGIAADAAGRGLRVVLCEKSDLAGATSSWSSKLIHGGLRYLEYYEFGLVRKSLQEREVLTKAAPHLIQPLAFQIPLLPHSRSSLLLRAGLFLYDNLARRELYPASRHIRFGADSALRESITQGFEYWDGQADDSRLVVSNALQAQAHGAKIITRSECTAISESAQGWRVTLHDNLQQSDSTIICKAIVNATGPWVASLLEKLTQSPPPHAIRLVKGSHIVVPRMHPGKQAFMLQHHDKRIVFVIPYLDDFTLIGTTEEEYDGDLDDIRISDSEISYLVSITNLYFKAQISPAQILHTFSGVRPLIDEQGKSASSVSRDYRLETVDKPHPIISVYGGKVTTYRVLAESVLEKLGEFFPQLPGPWTGQASLPGGDFQQLESLHGELTSAYPWLDAELVKRWQHAYGTRSFEILQDVQSSANLGLHFGNTLYQLEVDYLCTREWARSADDILWRRSKLGYKFSDAEIEALSLYLSQTYSFTEQS
jgi:glycerol-3-phosphate dehydrogenase